MLPRRWKIFKVVCMLQLILSGYMAGRAFVFFMMTGRGFFALDTICFTLIVLFASLGITIIHNNYPDTLLENSRKRYFNFLYLINVLLISFIGAHVFSERWAISLAFVFEFTFLLWISLMLDVILYVFILFLQVRLLFGMFWLRRELYANYRKLVNELADEPTS